MTIVKTMDPTDADAYIEAVLEKLGKLPSEYSSTAVTATMLICNMALDHAVASPQLLRKLNSAREVIIAVTGGRSNG